ncbi:MAG: hypothetical protein GXP55_19700 [Deltaproteobacteria bacterium]|nr:hypothetical protein [Deltaproteobacteria bacterium]
MSLDDTGLTLWELKKKPLALLVAVKASGLVVAGLPADAQAPFLALSKTLASWWPGREPAPQAIYDSEFRACLERYETFEPAAKMQPALNAAYVQMGALLKAAPKSLPAEIYEIDATHFQQLLRAAAKSGRLPIAQLDARLKSLLENSKQKWPELVARAERMSWVKSAPWGKLDKRLRALASLADLGAASSWTDVGGRPALRIELDGTARIAMLTPDEIEALRVVVPNVVVAPLDMGGE